MESLGQVFSFVHQSLVFILVALLVLAIAVIAILLRVFKNDFNQD